MHLFAFSSISAEYLQNFEFLISWGSVATCLTWSGYCRMSFVANFIRFPALQKFWQSVTIWQSYKELKGGNFFWDTVYIDVVRNNHSEMPFAFPKRPTKWKHHLKSAQLSYNQWRRLVWALGANPPNGSLRPPSTMKHTGEESTGELCEISKFWSFLLLQSVNNVCRLLQLFQTPWTPLGTRPPGL